MCNQVGLSRRCKPPWRLAGVAEVLDIALFIQASFYHIKKGNTLANGGSKDAEFDDLKSQ